MDFAFNEAQNQIRDAIHRICGRYGDDYWLDKDRKGEFPEELARDSAAAGWLGIALLEAWGGAGAAGNRISAPIFSC